MRLINTFLVFCALCSTACCYAESNGAAHPRKLRVAAVLSLTGPAAVHGHNILAGLTLAKKDLEKDGWDVQLLVDDDGTNSARTVASIQKFAAQGVGLFVGPTWSFLIAAAAPALQRQNLLAYAPAASWEVGGGPNPSVLFGTRISSDKEPVFTAWMQSHHVKNLAIVVANSDWADVHMEIIKRAAKDSGVTITQIASYNYGDEESALPTIALKVQKDNPDTVFSTGSKEGLAKLVRLFEDYKFKTNVLGLEDLRDAQETQLIPKKISYLKMYSVSQPFSKAFVQRFNQEYGKNPGIYSDAAYDGLRMFAKAVEAVGDSPPAVRDYLRSEQFSYQGYVGLHKFTKNGNTAAGEYQIYEVTP